jgi:hypothetical protein
MMRASMLAAAADGVETLKGRTDEPKPLDLSRIQAPHKVTSS